jgi:Transposase, Mutator family
VSCSRQLRKDLIAFYSFPPEHWTKLRSTNPLERVNKEIGRRADAAASSTTAPGPPPVAGPPTAIEITEAPAPPTGMTT